MFFSSDRVNEEGLREKGIRNVMVCFMGCLEELVGVEGNGWSKERVERVREEAMREVHQGVYCTLNQACIAGKKA
jgi:hypothetical protein